MISWLLAIIARQKTIALAMMCIICPCAGCSNLTVAQRNPAEETFHTQSAFVSADSDHDGQLTWSEFKEFLTRTLLKHNTNAWNTLSAQEQEALFFSWFLARDRGAKGFLTLADWLR